MQQAVFPNAGGWGKAGGVQQVEFKLQEAGGKTQGCKFGEWQATVGKKKAGEQAGECGTGDKHFAGEVFALGVAAHGSAPHQTGTGRLVGYRGHLGMQEPWENSVAFPWMMQFQFARRLTAG